MKAWDNKNYYQVLEVPADAGTCDIKRAYHEALATYDEDALATYSLFTDQQRAEILETIECAFETLIDEKKRTQYNRQLFDPPKGAMVHSMGGDPQAIDPLTTALNQSKSDSLRAWVQMKSGDKEIAALKEGILGKERISGRDLKRLRCAFGIDHADIYDLTRISRAVIDHIEQDCFDALPAEIYLKHFLKSYAELLSIEPQAVVDGYLNNMP